MAYNALKLGNSYLLDYTEVDEHFHTISTQYDFYVFNYHHWTMGWLDTKEIKSLPGLKATIVSEVLPNNPFVLYPKDDFNNINTMFIDDKTMNNSVLEKLEWHKDV